VTNRSTGDTGTATREGLTHQRVISAALAVDDRDVDPFDRLLLDRLDARAVG
jgi:hypothetical protein